jgi:nucleoside-diphosphate-sugar epimerase
MNEPNTLHVVLGAGQIGALVSDLLVASGQRVRQVRRAAAGAAHPLREWMRGDVRDLAFVEEATRGAAVIYDCLNPANYQWDDLLFPLARAAMHGAAKSGARLVALDNLYMYGRPDGAMTEDTPMRPCSRKGAMRVQLAEERLAAHRRGDVRVAIARASDFFGPGTSTQATVFGERFYQRVLAGKKAEIVGDPDLPHAYSYCPDVARGLIALGGSEEAMGKVWHLPTHEAETTRATIARFARALGEEVRITRVPTFLLRTAGVFAPIFREVAEMIYQWEIPYALDDRRFRVAFGFGPTPMDEAMIATAAWARATYGVRRAA